MRQFENDQDVFEVDGSSVEVLKVSDGLAFGEGSISGDTTGLQPEITDLVDSEIKDANRILLAVDLDTDGKTLDDDGCGDGRGVKAVFVGDQIRKRSLTRAKVFGGGLTMGVATRIGLGTARGDSLNVTFRKTQDAMQAAGIEYGAHTDTHADDTNCGCGAIDKAPRIISNIVTYETQIKDTINALGVDTNGLDDVLASYRSYAAEVADQPYSGRDVMEAIQSRGKVIKQLDGSHKEKRIILNMVSDTTVNQGLVRTDSENEMQVFATDVWRLAALARRMYPEDAAKQQQAFLSELVYTLGVAGTLTKGDLPVHIVQRVQDPVAA